MLRGRAGAGGRKELTWAATQRLRGPPVNLYLNLLLKLEVMVTDYARVLQWQRGAIDR